MAPEYVKKYPLHSTNISPQRLALAVTEECNLRCRHCFFWRKKDRADEELNLAEKIKILDDFKNINNHGLVYFTGGEPLLKQEQLIKLIKHCRQNALHCWLTSNGTLINTPALAEILVAFLPHITISLDSSKENIFDFNRGAAGTFQKVITAIKLLQQARIKTNSKTKIIIACIIMEHNYRELAELITFLKKLGVDGVFFQTLYMFSPSEYYPRDNQQYRQQIDKLIEQAARDPFITMELTDLFFLKEMNQASVYYTDRPYCNSFEKNIFIDLYGNVSLCGLSCPVGNIRTNSLKDIWQSDLAAKQRTVLANCALICGACQPHRKTYQLVK